MLLGGGLLVAGGGGCAGCGFGDLGVFACVRGFGVYCGKILFSIFQQFFAGIGIVFHFGGGDWALGYNSIML